MRHSSSSFIVMLSLLFATPTVVFTNTSTYTVIDISGSSLTVLHAINDLGQILGWASLPGGAFCFVREPNGTINPHVCRGGYYSSFNDREQWVGPFNDNGRIRGLLIDAANDSITLFDAPDAVSTYPRTMNDLGQIVGTFLDSAPVLRGFLRDPGGSATILEHPDAHALIPAAINNAGQIAGAFAPKGGGSGISFLREPNGTITRTNHRDNNGYPISTRFIAMNDLGQIVGTLEDIYGVHGMLREPDGTMVLFDVPGPPISHRYFAINNARQIVGALDDEVRGNVYFLRTPDGTITLFPSIPVPGFGFETSYPVSINNTGQIVGTFWDDQRRYGFITTVAKILGGGLPPHITSIDPASGPIDTSVTIGGSDFGVTQGSSTVTFGSTLATVTLWSDTQIQVTAPSLPEGMYDVIVTTSNGDSNQVTFEIITCPSGPPLNGTLVHLNSSCPSRIKVPLGKSVRATDDPGHFQVYVPTKWGGKLNITATSGTIANLQYPDGTSYMNDSEIGEDKHGWYTFQVVGSGSYTVKTRFTQIGEAVKRPWDFFYWPRKGSYIREPLGSVNGTAESVKRVHVDDIQVIAPGHSAARGADIILSGPNGRLQSVRGGNDEIVRMINLFSTTGHYQPLVKYDARHGTKARVWEAAHHQASATWCGHCLGATIASIKLNQPVPVAGLLYDTDELEGLWAELGEHEKHGWGDAVGLTMHIPAGPPSGGSDGTDWAAPNYHRILEQYVKSAREALVSNLRAAPDQLCSCKDMYMSSDVCPGPGDIWNHAVYKFEATFREAPGDNEMVVKIHNTVSANSDRPPPTDDTIDRQVIYEYTITYTTDGSPDIASNVTKDWTKVKGQACWAPGWLVRVETPLWRGENRYVTEPNVRADDAANP